LLRILHHIWRCRLPGVCESGALTILAIPSRDCPPLVVIVIMSVRPSAPSVCDDAELR